MKYNLEKNKYEPIHYFEIRKKIINSIDIKNNKDFKYYDNLSHIFINIISFKCRYNAKTEKIIFDIVKKIKNNNLNKLLPLNYNSLKVSELKNLLKKKKLPTNGKKNILIARLESS